jgi:steroid delta-isomerase-like uncharacterized protein
MQQSPFKKCARAYFENLLNAGDMNVVERIFTRQVQFNYPLGSLSGHDEVRQYITAVRTAFLDIRFEIHDLFGEQDLVGCRWTLTGMQTGEFRGNPPTGRSVEVPGNTIFRAQGGKINELWIAFDPSLLI